MSKKIKILLIVLLSIVTLVISTFNFKVQAATTGTITFKASATSVKAGDVFTITVHIKSSDGINGMGANYKYNGDALELQSAKTVGEGWSSLSGDNEIAIIRADEQSVTEADVFVLTFKVKDNVSVGTKIEFNVTDIYLSTFNEDMDLNNQTVSLTVVKQEEKVDDDKNNTGNKDNTDDKGDKDNTGDKNDTDNKGDKDNTGDNGNNGNNGNTDNKGDEPGNKDDTDNKGDNTDKKEDTDNKDNNSKNETNNKDITITVSDDNKNNTSADGEKYPKAGVCTISIIALGVICLVSVTLYKKYNNIQIK